uniref:Uncharacterized protein n=1 Tax=Plectus sambesii TaxID=2011161 RepID=A0A914VFJ4_9BILA
MVYVGPAPQDALRRRLVHPSHPGQSVGQFQRASRSTFLPLTCRRQMRIKEKQSPLSAFSSPIYGRSWGDRGKIDLPSPSLPVLAAHSADHIIPPPPCSVATRHQSKKDVDNFLPCSCPNAQK